jgi:hypothetical protein
MNNRTSRKRLFSTTGLFGLLLAAQIIVLAQGGFKAGDKVSASPSMLKDEKYYRDCTVVKFDTSSNAYILDCDGTEYAVPSSYVRAAKNPAKDEPAPVDKPNVPNPDPPANGTNASGEFKVGDRVMASVSGLKADEYYRPCTITSLLKDNAYGLRCDPHHGQPSMDFSVRPEWVKAAGNIGPAPKIECPFYKNYAKVSENAPPSAEVFKSVIFHHKQSVSDFYDFGLTFLDFGMGAAFTNVSVGRGRLLVDAARLGAKIYPVKSQELMCQKSSTITRRWVREIEYACFKDELDRWVCRNGAPRDLEPPTSIPNN